MQVFCNFFFKKSAFSTKKPQIHTHLRNTTPQKFRFSSKNTLSFDKYRNVSKRNIETLRNTQLPLSFPYLFSPKSSFPSFPNFPKIPKSEPPKITELFCRISTKYNMRGASNHHRTFSLPPTYPLTPNPTSWSHHFPHSRISPKFHSSISTHLSPSLPKFPPIPFPLTSHTSSTPALSLSLLPFPKIFLSRTRSIFFPSCCSGDLQRRSLRLPHLSLLLSPFLP